jgi:hypothetical protein
MMNRSFKLNPLVLGQLAIIIDSFSYDDTISYLANMTNKEIYFEKRISRRERVEYNGDQELNED